MVKSPMHNDKVQVRDLYVLTHAAPSTRDRGEGPQLRRFRRDRLIAKKEKREPPT